MKHRALALLLAALALSPALAADSEDDLPWAFNNAPADGYSITLVSAVPAPGEELIAGTSVEFKINVSYELAIAERGIVALVFQDEKNRPAAPDGTQVPQKIAKPGGTLVLSQTLVVPKKAKELRIFVALAPDGARETQGEVVIRYPIAKAPQ